MGENQFIKEIPIGQGNVLTIRTTDVPGEYEIVSPVSYTGTLEITAPWYKPLTKNIEFKPLEVATIEANIQDPILPETLILTVNGVTEEFTYELIQDDPTVEVSNFEVTRGSSPGEENKFNITATAKGTCIIRFKGISIEDTDYRIVFLDKRHMSSQIIPSNGITGTDHYLEVTIDNVYGDVSGVSDNEFITIEKVLESSTSTKMVYKVRTTQEDQNGNITFTGDWVDSVTIPVAFKIGYLEEPTITLEPVDGIQEANRLIDVKVSNTTRSVEAGVSGSGILETLDPYHMTVTSKEPNDVNLIIGGQGIRSELIPLQFTGIVQFVPVTTSLKVSQYDLPYKLKINRPRPDIKVVSDNFALSAEYIFTGSEGYVVIKTMEGYYDKDVSANLILKSEGCENVLVNVNVFMPTVKEDMPMNGAILRAIPNQEVFIKLPEIDYNDEVSAVAITDGVIIRHPAEQPDRFYFKANKEGVYEIMLKHTEYKDATIKFIVKEQPKDTTILNPDEEIFDLGKPNVDVDITTITDDFVTDVFTSPLLKTDKERLCYLIAKGVDKFKYTATKICQYNEAMKPGAPKLSMKEGAEWNYKLWSVLKLVLSIKDYYEFREQMKIVLKCFKIYKDESLKDYNLMRYDMGWRWGESDLERFKLFSVFLTKYVALNGEKVRTYGLTFDADTMEKLNNFCGENINP